MMLKVEINPATVAIKLEINLLVTVPWLSGLLSRVLVLPVIQE